MFRKKYQGSLLTILYSCGSSPLEIWGMHVKNGYIRRIIDDEVKSLALEIAGTNVATTYIYCPVEPKNVLGIMLPFLIMIIKNMKKYFTFEITILDDKNMHRRFRVSNFQSTTRVRPFCTSMPIGLSGGWNQIQFNLADFTRRAYGSNYVETTKMQIHANCRIRRIYFANRLYTEDELPTEYKLFLPIHRKKCVREESKIRLSAYDEPPMEEPPAFVTETPLTEATEEMEETYEIPIPSELDEHVPPMDEEEAMEDEEEEEEDEELEDLEHVIRRELGVDEDEDIYEGPVEEATKEEEEEEDMELFETRENEDET